MTIFGRTHEINTSYNLFQLENDFFARTVSNRSAVVIVSPTFYSINGSNILNYLNTHDLKSRVLVRLGPSREESKTLLSVLEILGFFKQHQLRRRDLAIALGGGICCDTVGLAATLYRRGIPHIKIPTTLLGIVDAGIGIKNGVNGDLGKNKIGTFMPPAQTIVDTSCLFSLPEDEILNGVSEMMKMGLVVDQSIYCDLSQLGDNCVALLKRSSDPIVRELIENSIQSMQNQLAIDPYESGVLERAVDFGHTFSPQIEMESEYKISHGKAVSIDMSLSICLSSVMNWISDDIAIDVISTFDRIGLCSDFEFLEQESYRRSLDDAVLHRNGSLALPLPFEKVGQHRFLNDPAEIEDLLGPAKARLRSIKGAGTNL